MPRRPPEDSRLLYRIAAELLVLLHLFFIIFVLFGGLAVYKWHWLAWLHVPAAAWGAVVEYRSWVCPLTPWENQLRRMAGLEGYSEGFIEHYIIPIVYPPGITRETQLWLGAAVLLINVLVYGILLYRKMRS